jgi:hypothetical protein
MSPSGRELAFVPETPWVARRRYALVAAPFLEDVSGNRPGRPFERAVDAADGDAATANRREFVVR